MARRKGVLLISLRSGKWRQIAKEISTSTLGRRSLPNLLEKEKLAPLGND